MTWLAWRQLRTQVAVVFGVLVALAIALAITGPIVAHLHNAAVEACRGRTNCSVSTSSTFQAYKTLRAYLGILVVVAPGLLGLFWGAPLIAREIEAGTYRLAWTQSVSRTRWLLTKLGLVGLASVTAAGLLSLMVTWWASPIDQIAADPYGLFDRRDIVPIGYALFAFALGLTAGIFIRRVVPAMAGTLVAFVAARIAFTNWLRPHLMTPLHQSSPLTLQDVGFGSMNGGPFTLLSNPANISRAWVYSTNVVDRSGTVITSQYVNRTCPKLLQALPSGGPGPAPGQNTQIHVRVPGGVQQGLQDCVTKISASYHQLVVYQPSSRYWTFQWEETVIYCALALVLCGVSAWWVRHRIA